MTGQWPIIRLGDLVDPKRGITYGIVQPGQHVTDGVPIVRVSDLKGDRVDIGKPMIVSREIEAAYSRTRLKGGELIMSIVGTVGQTAIVDQSLAGWNVARAVAVIPVLEDIGAYWIRLSLRGGLAKDHIDARLNTTVQATLNLKDLSNLPIAVPPQAERNAIAATLGALDDKIELNRKMNETLEAMARALFRDWFVDFGPTRAKMALSVNGAKNLDKSTAPYLSPDLWSLFPDRLDDEGKPEGWELRRIDQLLELAYGKALRATDRKPGNVPVYGSGGITGAHSEALVEGPSVIVGRKGTVGSLYWEDRPFFPIDTVFYVRPIAPLSFCYHCLEQLGLSEMNTDAAVPGLNRNNVYRLEVAWPGKCVVDAFAEFAAMIRDAVRRNIQESRTLAHTRDLLLPRLMSGELRIAPAECIAEEVL